MSVSAAIGGIDLAFNGAKMMDLPKEYLTVFSSFVIPGLILLFIVGGANFIAGITVLKRSKKAVEWSAVAGFGSVIWFFSELYIFRGTHYIQIIYFAVSIAILILTLAAERYGFARKNLPD